MLALKHIPLKFDGRHSLQDFSFCVNACMCSVFSGSTEETYKRRHSLHMRGVKKQKSCLNCVLLV